MKRTNNFTQTQTNAMRRVTLAEELDNFEEELYTHRPTISKGSRNLEQIERLKIRKRNLPKFVEKIDAYCNRHLGFNHKTSFGIDDKYSIGDIPTVFSGPDYDTQKLPMGYNDEFREKLMACPKYRVFETMKMRALPNFVKSKAKVDTQFHIFETYYVGVVDGQAVLFKEEVMYPTKRNPITGSEREEDGAYVGYTQNSGDYELKAIIGGSANGVLELCRFDHNRQHGNVFDSSGNCGIHNYPINNSHVHYNTLMFQVAFPNSQDSADAYEVNTRELSFPLCVRAIRNSLNMPMMQTLLHTGIDEKTSIADAGRKCDEIYYDSVSLNGRMIDRFEYELDRFRSLNASQIIDDSHKPIIKGEFEKNKEMQEKNLGYDAFESMNIK